MRVDLARAERGQPDLDVAEQLDRRPTGAAGDERAERRIADRAHDQLRPGRRHALDLEPLGRRAGIGEPTRDLAGGTPHGGRPGQIQLHAAGIALVAGTRHDRLERDRPAELRGRPGRGRRRGDKPTRHHRDAPAAEQALDIRGRQPASDPAQPLGDDRRRCRAVDAGRLRGRVGRRRPATRVADGVDQRPDRLLGRAEARDRAGVGGRRRVGAQPDAEHRPVSARRAGGDGARDLGRPPAQRRHEDRHDRVDALVAQQAAQRPLVVVRGRRRRP